MVLYQFKRPTPSWSGDQRNGLFLNGLHSELFSHETRRDYECLTFVLVGRFCGLTITDGEAISNLSNCSSDSPTIFRSRYYEDSAHLVREIKVAAKSIKASHEPYKDLVDEYTSVLAYVERILNSLKRGNLYQEEVTEEMERLQEEYSKIEKTRIKGFLEVTKYRISEPSVLVTVVGRAERIENVSTYTPFIHR